MTSVPDQRLSASELQMVFLPLLEDLPLVIRHTYNLILNLSTTMNGKTFRWQELKSDVKKMMGVQLEHQMRHSLPFHDSLVEGLDLSVGDLSFDLKTPCVTTAGTGFTSTQNQNVALVVEYCPIKHTFDVYAGYPDEYSNHNADGKYYLTVKTRKSLHRIMSGTF